MKINKEHYQNKFNELTKEGHIVRSDAGFKIKLFLDKSFASFLIAKKQATNNVEPDKIYWLQWSIIIGYYSILYAAKAAILKKGYEVKTHMAAQIALGHLLVPDELEKEDLEILDQAHKIIEDEYVKYFEDAKKESSIARYSARPTYTERRVKEILKNSQLFIRKIDAFVN